MIRIFPLKLYLQKWYIGWPIAISFCLNMLSWFWLITQMSRSDELLTLHHNILFGVDYIGPLWKAYYVPTLGLSIIVLNAVLGWLLYRKDTFMAQLLNIIALFASIFVFIATYMIVYWNI